MRQVYALFLFLMLLLGTQACKNTNNSAALTAAMLDGSDWDLRMIESKGQAQKLPADVSITMAFLDGRLNGRSACNDYSAPYTMDQKKLQVGQVAATEMYCVHDNWEGQFFNAIQAAESCELQDSSLVLNCAQGVKLRFSKRTLKSIAQGEARSAELASLLKLFPGLPPNQTHFYSIVAPDKFASYPFVGETIPPTMFDLFDPSSASMFRQASTLGAYAVGKIGDLYILRVPGNKGANTIALYLLKNNKLAVEMPLAIANDEPSVNIQQDAWLADLDRDGKLEVIVRQISAPQGGTAQDVIRAFAQVADGSYQPALQLQPKVKDYPLERLK
jgi:heat shock protein HslJ